MAAVVNHDKAIFSLRDGCYSYFVIFGSAPSLIRINVVVGYGVVPGPRQGQVEDVISVGVCVSHEGLAAHGCLDFGPGNRIVFSIVNRAFNRQDFVSS